MNVLKVNVPGGGHRLQVRATLAGMRGHVTGSGAFETILASWRDVLVEVRKRQPTSLLLIDEIAAPPLSNTQWRMLVEAMRGQGLEDVRVAHVKPSGRQGFEVWEQLSRGIGIDLRVFDNEAAAALWLDFEVGDHVPAPGRQDFGLLTVSHDFDLPDILRVRIAGQGGDAGASLRVWLHLMELARASGRLRILAILDMSGPVLTEQEMTAVVTRLAGIAPVGLRVAMVETRDERLHYDESASLAVIDRGFSARVFANEISAATWLRYGAR